MRKYSPLVNKKHMNHERWNSKHFCHYLSDLYVYLSDLYFDLSLIHLLQEFLRMISCPINAIQITTKFSDK